MPRSGSTSPSFRKMNRNLEGNGVRRRKKFSFGEHQTENKVEEQLLKWHRSHRWRSVCSRHHFHSIRESLSLSLLFTTYADHRQLAWLITFIASVIAQIKTNFPNFAWWAIAYTLVVIIFVFIAVGSDSTHTYQVAVSCRAARFSETKH